MDSENLIEASSEDSPIRQDMEALQALIVLNGGHRRFPTVSGRAPLSDMCGPDSTGVIPCHTIRTRGGCQIPREHLRSQIDLEDPRFMTDEDELLSRIVS